MQACSTNMIQNFAKDYAYANCIKMESAVGYKFILICMVVNWQQIGLRSMLHRK